MDEIIWSTIAHLPYIQILAIWGLANVFRAMPRIVPIIIVFLALTNQNVNDRLIALIQATKK